MELTVGPLAPEIYAYNFTIDGIKTIDPGNYEVKTGSTASTIELKPSVTDENPRDCVAEGTLGGDGYPNGITAINGFILPAARRLSRIRFTCPRRVHAASSAFAPWKRYSTGY